MADIRSRPSTDTYRENWDRIFGKKKIYVTLDDLRVASLRLRMSLIDDLAGAMDDSHPAAD